MNSEYFGAVLDQRNQWLEEQIRQMSVDVLRLGAFTCTACGEVVGDYILDFAGERHRLSGSETYALLKFLITTRASLNS